MLFQVVYTEKESLPIDTNGNLKLEPKIFFYDKNLDLNEIPEQTDISVNIQTKTSSEAAKRPLKKEKTDSIILF